MHFDGGDRESHALRGAIDVTKLDAFRDAFTTIEPMASGAIDDRLNPRDLRLAIPYGVGEADTSIFTVRWTTAILETCLCEIRELVPELPDSARH